MTGARARAKGDTMLGDEISDGGARKNREREVRVPNKLRKAWARVDIVHWIDTLRTTEHARVYVFTVCC